MPDPVPLFDTSHVLSRRLLAWGLDLVIVAVLLAVLHLALAIFGLLTLGLGWTLFGLLPAVPFLFSFVSLAGRHAATPGQRVLGVAAIHHAEGRRPTLLEALVSTVLFYISLTFLPLMLLALVTSRHRTLHDLLSGLVIIRTQPLRLRGAAWNMPDGRPV